MVKVLIIHGFGVNASIFKAQTAPVRALLPSHWEYNFVQGPLRCGPAPGIGEIYSGQTYHSWYHVPSLKELRAAHDFLEEVIDEEGPFDVAWGFSAGAMITASFLLRHAHETPHLPPPFRCAIFMNTYIPWSATTELGLDVTPLVIQHQSVPCKLADADRLLELERKKNPTIENMLHDERSTKWNEGDLIPSMMKGLYQDVHKQDVERAEKRGYEDYRSHRMFPELDKVRINIPSAHIIGEMDAFKEQGSTMLGLCDPGTTRTHTHGFGHEIPVRSPKDLKKIAEAIEKTAIRSEFA